MKFRISLLAVLVLVTAATAYSSGRWAFFLIVPPVIIPAFLSLVASLLLLVPRTGDSSFWNRWHTRFSALGLCWLFLMAPFLAGDGFFEIGRRAHIRSLFSPELIAELRASASKLSARKSQFGDVSLSPADLPLAVGSTAWRFPGHASCAFDDAGRLTSVYLTWGGALIAHHGLVISDEHIPLNGEGYHFTDDQGKDIVEHPRRYYPLYLGSYILIDDH